MKKQIPLSALLKLISFYSLIVGIIGAIFLIGVFVIQQQNKTTPKTTITATPSPSISPTDTPNSEGEFCGGIAGIQCPDGYSCQLDGNYPDAGGKCVKQKRSTSEEDQVFCTMDAKQCPDGSFVGREGPNCEFAACPGN